MKPNFLLSCLGILILSSTFSQVQTLTLNPEKDATFRNDSPTNNDNGPLINVGRFPNRALPFQQTTYHTKRAAVYFNFDSIPSNAIVISAELRIFGNSGGLGSPTFKTIKMTSSWSESGINWSTANSIVDPTISSTFTANGINQIADVKSQVQTMITGAYNNYGWVILLNSSETISANKFQDFGSRQNSNNALKPQLEIKYYIPMSVDAATIMHESGLNTNNGSISPSLINGPGGTYTYEWKNSSGTLVGANVSLTGIQSGWYGLKVTSTTSGSKPFFYSFLVGNYCQATSFNYNPGPDFVDDATLVTSSSNPSAAYSSYPNVPTIYSGEAYSQGTSICYRNLLRFRVWIDDQLLLDDATLKLRLQSSSGANSSKLIRALDNWDEYSVADYNKPSTSQFQFINLPSVTGSNVIKQFDALNQFKSWRSNNSSNFGWLMQLDNYNYSNHHQYYYSSDYGTSSYRPSVDFSYTVTPPPFVNSTWDTILDRGSITINTENLCGETAPFKYIISERPIPELTISYQLFLDSVSSSIMDSASFFNGSSLTAMTFDNLLSSKYYISVFNNDWNRIVNDSIQLQGPLIFESSNGLTINNNEITSNTSDGRGLLKAFTHQGVNSEIFFKLNQLMGEQFVGYVPADGLQPTSYSQLLYGFRISTNKVYCIANGNILGSSIIILAPDELSLKIENGVLYYKNGNTILQSKTLNPEFQLKVTIGLKNPSTVVKFKRVGVIFHKLPLYLFSGSVNQHLTCNGDNGEFNFSIYPMLYNNGSNLNYTVKDPNNQVVKVGNAYVLQSILISSYSNGDPLTLTGVYTISGNFGVNNNTFTGSVRLGFEADWNQYTDYVQSPNNYSLTIQNSNPTYYAHGYSRNMLSVNESGWIQFNVKSPNSFISNLCRPSVTNIMDPPFSNVLNLWPNGINENFLFTINSGTIVNPYTTLYVYNSGTSSIVNTPLPSAAQSLLVRLEFDNIINPLTPNGSMKVYVNNVYLTTVSRNLSSVLARFNSNKVNCSFENVICSFGCKKSENIYARLKYELDGYYHVMKNGKIKFIFNEEYNTGTLRFNIYNINDDLVKTNQDFPTEVVTNGMNEIELDVTTSAQCLGKGYFYLETINSKNEKMYLRFHNDFISNYCPNY